jgi:hypothetical protein
MLDPVFNAARLHHCAMKPLEPELCPAIVERLKQRGWAMVQRDSSSSGRAGGGVSALAAEGRGVQEQLRSAAPRVAEQGGQVNQVGDLAGRVRAVSCAQQFTCGNVSDQSADAAR